MKNEDIKSLVTALESQEITLEDLLTNTDFIQPTIKIKFQKFSKYFMRREWIEKLIYYSLNYDSQVKNYTSVSHNACEILSQVKHSAFLKEITKCEDVDDNNKSFPYLDKIFDYLTKKEKKIKEEIKLSNKMEIDSEADDLYCEEMLSGYFERIVMNFTLKVKKRVSFLKNNFF